MADREWIPKKWMGSCGALCPNRAESESNITILKNYALTYNICSNIRVNGKIWGTYEFSKQVYIITKIVQAAFKLFDVIWEDCNMFFEATSEGVAHLHAIISGRTADVLMALEAHLNKKHTPKHDYKTCLIKEEYDHPGWHRYITKDQ